MARQLRPITPLAELILAGGRPAYVVAAEVGINYNRLLDYADGRLAPTTAHQLRLDRYFDTHEHTTGDDVEPIEPEPPVTFGAVLRQIRSLPGREGVLSLLVVDRAEAARVSSLMARDEVLDIEATDPWTDAVSVLRARPEAAVYRPGQGLELRFRIDVGEGIGGALLQHESSSLRVRLQRRTVIDPHRAG
jgi:hypothetical protein